MQSSTIRINGRSNIVKLAALFGFGSYLATMLEIAYASSFLFACSLLTVAVNYLVFIAARKRVRLEDLVILAITFMSVLMSDWQLNFDYYKPAIITLCTVICIDLCPESSIDEESIKLVTWVLLLVAVVTNLQYYRTELRGSYSGSANAVTLFFSNPNTTGTWLVFIIVLLSDAMRLQKKLGLRLLFFLFMLSILPILYRTQSRNGLIAIAFFFVGKAVLRIFRIGRFPSWCIFLIALAPLVTYVGYMHFFIPNYDKLSKWFLFFVSEGKSLTSRSYIWSDLEMNTIKDILFGNYGRYHGGNMHNAMVSIYCSYGIVYAAIVCRKIYRSMKKMANAGMQVALGAVWLTGCFEASIFAGMAGMYMLLLLLPVFHQQRRTSSG